MAIPRFTRSFLPAWRLQMVSLRRPGKLQAAQTAQNLWPTRALSDGGGQKAQCSAAENRSLSANALTLRFPGNRRRVAELIIRSGFRRATMLRKEPTFGHDACDKLHRARQRHPQRSGLNAAPISRSQTKSAASVVTQGSALAICPTRADLITVPITRYLPFAVTAASGLQ